MREKLIELVLRMDITDNVGNIVDFLIANGVTIQKWIPVSERLPDRSGEVLVCTKHFFYDTRNIAKAVFKKGSGGFYGNGGHWKNVTHWMELPEPPKEEP